MEIQQFILKQDNKRQNHFLIPNDCRILLIGSSGSGKTTLLTYLLTYF